MMGETAAQFSRPVIDGVIHIFDICYVTHILLPI